MVTLDPIHAGIEIVPHPVRVAGGKPLLADGVVLVIRKVWAPDHDGGSRREHSIRCQVGGKSSIRDKIVTGILAHHTAGRKPEPAETVGHAQQFIRTKVVSAPQLDIISPGGVITRTARVPGIVPAIRNMTIALCLGKAPGDLGAIAEATIDLYVTGIRRVGGSSGVQEIEIGIVGRRLPGCNWAWHNTS